MQAGFVTIQVDFRRGIAALHTSWEPSACCGAGSPACRPSISQNYISFGSVIIHFEWFTCFPCGVLILNWETLVGELVTRHMLDSKALFASILLSFQGPSPTLSRHLGCLRLMYLLHSCRPMRHRLPAGPAKAAAM